MQLLQTQVLLLFFQQSLLQVVVRVLLINKVLMQELADLVVAEHMQESLVDLETLLL